MSFIVWLRLACLSVILLGLSLVPGWSQNVKGKKYALLVGVTKYDEKNFTTLQYTENDAEKMATQLEKVGFTKVRILTNKRGAKESKDSPTAANIVAALRELVENKTRNDLVLVGLSGHGVQIELSDPEEKGEPKQYSYFCPKDASELGISYKTGRSKKLILLDDLFADMGKSGAGHRLALIDACRNELRAAGRKRNIDPNSATIPSGVGVLFSCSRGQFAFETEKLKHGVFFHHAIKGIGGEAKNRKGAITWASLTDYLQDEVPSFVKKEVGGGAQQVPATMGNQEGGTVLVAESVPVDKTKVVPIPKRKPLTNSIDMTFQPIPAGKFTMGASKQVDADAEKDEKPHLVEITKDFYMGATEVTQLQWKKIMGDNPSYFSKDGTARKGILYQKNSPPAGGKTQIKNANPDNLPVENVSWDEVQEFIGKLNALELKQKSGRKYRLPTEAEWEYASRGGARDDQRFAFGNELSTEVANYNGELGRPREVGQTKANGYGLHDMHGNVWEWCHDYYGEYGDGPDRDPSGPEKGKNRSRRGGCYVCPPEFCRSAKRNHGDQSLRYNRLGFRLVLIEGK